MGLMVMVPGIVNRDKLRHGGEFHYECCGATRGIDVLTLRDYAFKAIVGGAEYVQLPCTECTDSAVLRVETILPDLTETLDNAFQKVK